MSKRPGRKKYWQGGLQPGPSPETEQVVVGGMSMHPRQAELMAQMSKFWQAPQQSKADFEVIDAFAKAQQAIANLGETFTKVQKQLDRDKTLREQALRMAFDGLTAALGWQQITDFDEQGTLQVYWLHPTSNSYHPVESTGSALPFIPDRATLAEITRFLSQCPHFLWEDNAVKSEFMFGSSPFRNNDLVQLQHIPSAWKVHLTRFDRLNVMNALASWCLNDILYTKEHLIFPSNWVTTPPTYVKPLFSTVTGQEFDLAPCPCGQGTKQYECDCIDLRYMEV